MIFRNERASKTFLEFIVSGLNVKYFKNGSENLTKIF